MLLWSWLLVSTTWAAGPTKDPGTFLNGNGGTITALALSQDLVVLTGANGAGDLVLVDVAGWIAASDSGVDVPECTVTAAAAAPRGTSLLDGYDVYVGCKEGTIQTWTWIADVLAPLSKSDSDASVLTTPTLGGEIAGLWFDATTPESGFDGSLYALVKGSTNLQGVKLTTKNGSAVKSTQTYTPNFIQKGFSEAFLVGTGSVDVWHGGSNFSQWTLASGTVIGTTNSGSSALTPHDAAPNKTTGALVVESPGTPGRLGFWTGQAGQPQQTLLTIDPNFGGADALVATWRETTPSYVVERGNVIDVFKVPATTTTSMTLELDHSFDVDFLANQLVEGRAGYVIAVTDLGQLAVMTANPWIDTVTLEPAHAVTGTTITLSFDVDEPGDWTVRSGGGPDSGGTKLMSGTATEPGAVETTFTVGDAFAEGASVIWVDHVSSATGLSGHARALLSVDNPPTGVHLTKGGIGIGNHKIFLDFTALTQSDIKSYNVYVSTEAFTRADYPTEGGPTGTVGKVTSPVSVEQPVEGGTVSVQISPLENDRTYWVAVRATDGTNEGGMSDVFSATPTATVIACVRKGGEDCEVTVGGSPCSTSPLGVIGWIATIGAATAIRRRRPALLLGIGGVLVAAAGPEARADDGEALPTATDDAAEPDEDELSELEAERLRQAEHQRDLDRRRNRSQTGLFASDTTPAWANFEFHGGASQLNDEALVAVYGKGSPILRFEAGLQLYRYFELDFGVGYKWKKGHALAQSTGERTREETRIQMLPLTIGATLRAHVVDEQPVVPYGSVGFTYIYWRENPLDAKGQAVKANRVNGSDFGWYWAGGGNILLDLLNPRRASILEATSGINDTWLTIEYRRQYVNPGSTTRFDLSGWEVTIGLKLDY